MLKAFDRCSLMGCSLEPDPNVLEAKTSKVLLTSASCSFILHSLYFSEYVVRKLTIFFRGGGGGMGFFVRYCRCQGFVKLSRFVKMYRWSFCFSLSCVFLAFHFFVANILWCGVFKISSLYDLKPVPFSGLSARTCLQRYQGREGEDPDTKRKADKE
jgi:hypothetical protein